MVAATLTILDSWFVEQNLGNDRPKLLSKLALLELCGWIEGEFDRLILVVEAGRLNDAAWVSQNIIKRTNGFTYADHWRPMLVRLIGEVFARRVEAQMDADFPGDLDRLKGLLSSLWKKRCSFAHADMAANIAAQQVFDAPSVTLNHHGDVTRLMRNYEQSLQRVLQTI